MTTNQSPAGGDVEAREDLDDTVLAALKACAADDVERMRKDIGPYDITVPTKFAVRFFRHAFLKGREFALAKLTSTKPEPSRIAEIAAEEWQNLLEKDDRNSPAEYPDMCLITAKELHGILREHITTIETENAALKADGATSGTGVNIDGHTFYVAMTTAAAIKGVLADRDKFEAGWKQAFDIGISHQDKIEALQAENAAMQSERDRMRQALEEIKSWKNDKLGSRSPDIERGAVNEAFDRGCGMAFFRCAVRATAALNPSTPEAN